VAAENMGVAGEAAAGWRKNMITANITANIFMCSSPLCRCWLCAFAGIGQDSTF
jgi:hypothetical protein